MIISGAAAEAAVRWGCGWAARGNTDSLESGSPSSAETADRDDAGEGTICLSRADVVACVITE